jgi:hypothetical protein
MAFKPDTGTQREIMTMEFRVPSLVHISSYQINDGAFSVGVCILISHVAIFDQETQLSGECNEKVKAVLFHACGICVLKRMSHADELLSIYTFAGLECATSLL